MSPLSPWQKGVLKTVRNDQRERGVLLYILTGSGIKSDDAYAVQTGFARSLLRAFSGAVAWSPSEQRTDSAAGYVQDADVIIAVDRQEKRFVDRKDTILEVDGIELRVVRIVDIPETDEIVISAEKV